MKIRIKKTDVNNKGLRMKFFLDKDFHLIPSLETNKFSFYRNSKFENKVIVYEFVTSKIFSWMWFRFSISLEYLSVDLVDNIPIVELFFDMLPPKINVSGKVFKLNFIKDDLVRISYVYQDETLFGEISSDRLWRALNISVEKLKETDNVRFMKHHYQKLYEKHFNIEVPQERKFEPYYE
jgi:hypothetical protein